MEITKIKHQSGNKYSLEVEGKKHVIYDDVLLAFNLYKPCKVSDKIWQEILDKNSFYEGYNKALSFINFKMRSIKEVDKKLTSLGISKTSKISIINKLTKEGYLNDEKYVKAFIQDQINLTPNGPKKIALELKKKGIKDDLIISNINDIDGAIWTNKALKIVNKKLKTKTKGSKEKIKAKLRGEMFNLGFYEEHFMDAIKDIEIDDTSSYEKDKAILEKKLAKKYEGEKLEYMVKQKLYALGYRKG